MKPLRIAQLAPLIESVPPRKYGGTERVVYHLTEALVARGHNVTLFASGDSRTSARLFPVVTRGLRLEGKPDTPLSSLLALARAYREMNGAFDIVHSHIDCFTFPFASVSDAPSVLTMHGRLDMPDMISMLRLYGKLNYVSISDSQRKPVPEINWVATIHHGYPPECFPYNDSPSDYYLYLGRLSPEKAPDQAIFLAREHRIPLKIAAKIDPSDRAYFTERIAPLLDDPLIDYVGEVGDREKTELLKNARALLNTIDWPEPFGLVMIESLACGTPVIVRSCGSAPEIVRHGKTGFLCSSPGDFAQAIRAVGTISREACRRDFEDRFSQERMADEYEKLYYRLLFGSSVENPSGVLAEA